MCHSDSIFSTNNISFSCMLGIASPRKKEGRPYGRAEEQCEDKKKAKGEGMGKKPRERIYMTVGSKGRKERISNPPNYDSFIHELMMMLWLWLAGGRRSNCISIFIWLYLSFHPKILVSQRVCVEVCFASSVLRTCFLTRGKSDILIYRRLKKIYMM